ncbi:hypothetical protein HPT25_09320 [Bacillus sp. BRMEA1]|uniref:EsaB/YukD family protein n=1 Tax=Neobacillus endophyticus TaxID=2738405 RepID=UPI001566A8C0|nr:EsaB/YukD family protein [Neobacillus endophyticus]NRD77646.1 hypothetical protein [Neobacillus endophyticus]
MPRGSHINVTVDFQKWDKGRYDVRIPVHQNVKQLLASLKDALDLKVADGQLFALKVPAKQLLLTDDDRLVDHPVTNGDILQVL